jgi:hypothetical protein
MDFLIIVTLGAIAFIASGWYTLRIYFWVQERGVLGIVEDIYAGRKHIATRPRKVSRGKKHARKNRTHA